MPARVIVGQLRAFTAEALELAVQLGATGVHINTPQLPSDDGRWATADLVAMREHVERYGLRLEAIENVPLGFYHHVLVGGPERDRQLAAMVDTITAIGAAGIPLLGYHFMPNFVWRTTMEAPGRGGARVSAYDGDQVADRPNAVRYGPVSPRVDLDTAAMWDNYRVFCEAVMPAAEAAGVRLALHPDDPPVARIDGVTRLFHNLEAYQEALRIAGDSPAWALDLCIGSISELGGEPAVLEMIRSFGPAGRIAYVHFRDVQGTVPRFQECFLGEGNLEPRRVMRALLDHGFDGFILDDHVPVLDAETEPYGRIARAHAVGYLQALLHAVR